MACVIVFDRFFVDTLLDGLSCSRAETPSLVVVILKLSATNEVAIFLICLWIEFMR